MGWLRPEDSRVGLGCMRLSTDADRDEQRARATVHAALDAGVTVFDTALAYGLDDTEHHHNERWLARFLSEHARGAGARLVTKGGLVREGARWVSDGRAKALRAHCEESRAALGRPIDLYLLHAPDPRVPLATSVRALEALRREGLVRAIGLSNVSRLQLEEATQHATLSAVQVGVSVFDSRALDGGVVARALELGLTVQCHTPLGGRKRVPRLPGVAWVRDGAARAAVTEPEYALAALLALGPQVMVLPGARRPETIVSAVRASRVVVDVTAGPWWLQPSRGAARGSPGAWAGEAGEVRAAPEVLVGAALSGVEAHARALASQPSATPSFATAMLLVMGIQGAGKSSHAVPGLRRLNRDARGGTLAGLNAELDAALARGERGFLLDNTLVTRAQRAAVLRIAERHGVPVHGRWLEIDPAQAQINIVRRMLGVHGRLLDPAELARGKTPDALSPNGFFRTLRSVEPPELGEGFATLETIPFVRRRASSSTPWVRNTRHVEEVAAPALVVGLEQLSGRGEFSAAARDAIAAHPEARLVVLGWREGGVTLPPSVINAVCPHGGGPPTCWCRPPLPGALLAAAWAHHLDLTQSRLVTTSPALRSLGAALGLAP